ncbi:MAG: tyrosine-type recombinase/integrase, partial [Planctomycetes bacterium]|nr:tyrosine-type recombinase/integrase [Planctomycetota bacterium]
MYSFPQLSCRRNCLVARIRGFGGPRPKNLWDIACWTGWRKQELLQLRWSQVDLERGVVRLDMYETKNDEAREVPFDICRDLVRAFNEQRDYTLRVQRETGKIIPFVFHHFGGKPIKHIDGARRKACRAAGAIGKDGRPKVLHSTRRTAARRLERAGVSRDIAMDIMGIKSESIFRRYNIRQNEDKRRAL